MTIYETLKTALKLARMKRDQTTITFVSTIIGELDGAAKKRKLDNQEVTDEEAVVYLKKYVQTNLDNLALVHDTITPEQTVLILAENNYLSQFLPTDLTDNQLNDVLLIGFDNLGSFMSYLKTHYAGRYDGKRASTLYKDFQGEGRAG